MTQHDDLKQFVKKLNYKFKARYNAARAEQIDNHLDSDRGGENVEDIIASSRQNHDRRSALPADYILTPQM